MDRMNGGFKMKVVRLTSRFSRIQSREVDKIPIKSETRSNKRKKEKVWGKNAKTKITCGVFLFVQFFPFLDALNEKRVVMIMEKVHEEFQSYMIALLKYQTFMKFSFLFLYHLLFRTQWDKSANWLVYCDARMLRDPIRKIVSRRKFMLRECLAKANHLLLVCASKTHITRFHIIEYNFSFIIVTLLS